MKTLAERLIWARTRKELSQESLSQLVPCSQSTIGNLESGLRVTARKITRLAEVLGVNANWLATGIGDPDKSVQMIDNSVETAEKLSELIDLWGKSDVEGRQFVNDSARRAASSSAQRRSKNGKTGNNT